MGSKKVALFADVESLHHQLRTLHNRSLDPAPLLEAAAARGEVVTSVALADWADVPPEVKAGLEGSKVEVVQVDRALRTRDAGGRRRDVARDVIDLEVLARVVELLFRDQGPEVDAIVIATGDDVAARTARVVRERFHKDVFVVGVEGAVGEPLKAAATAWEVLPMPPIPPRDLDGLAKLVPMLEELERRKRYLNFKYIRETVVRRLDLPERSFDAAERLLSDAIACGVLRKQKVEDKYNPGQLFTAYSIDRDNELFKRFGSGEPAPVFEEEPPPPAATSAPEGARRGANDARGGDAAGPPGSDAGPRREAVPALSLGGGRREPRDREPRDREPRDREPRDRELRDREPRDREPRDREPRESRAPQPRSAPRDDEGEGGGGRRRRRRRGRGGGDRGDRDRDRGAGDRGGQPGEAIPSPLMTSSPPGRGRRHGQDRLGRQYEAPSRFLFEEPPPDVGDEDIDEDKILRGRGDTR